MSPSPCKPWAVNTAVRRHISAGAVSRVADARDLHRKVMLAAAGEEQVEVDGFVEFEKTPEHRRRA
eukprot:3059576-Pyramimonas_sp.AAC.1